MYPEILHISFLHTYGALVALAFLAGLGIATRLAKPAGLNADAVVNLGIYCALSAIAGAKLMMFLVDIPYYSRYPSEIFTLATLQAGGVFYGGLIAAPGGPGDSGSGQNHDPSTAGTAVSAPGEKSILVRRALRSSSAACSNSSSVSGSVHPARRSPIASAPPNRR